MYEDTAISDDITTSTKQSGKFTGGLSYDFNVGTSKLYDYSNNSGSISFTRNATATSTSGDKADAYFRFGTLTADDYVLDHGRFIFKAKLTMNTSAYSMLLSVKGSNGGNSVTWYNNKDILSGGKFFDEIPVEKTGGDLEIGFACKYLIEILRGTDQPVLRLSLTSSLMSMVIEGESEEGDHDRSRLLLRWIS